MRVPFGRLHLILGVDVPGNSSETADRVRERFISSSGRFATPPNHWWRSLKKSLCCAVACSQECATSRYPHLQPEYFVIISRLPQVQRTIASLSITSQLCQHVAKIAPRKLPNEVDPQPFLRRSTLRSTCFSTCWSMLEPDADWPRSIRRTETEK
jgi:hypothetical protein